jgi:hypothetical protein
MKFRWGLSPPVKISKKKELNFADAIRKVGCTIDNEKGTDLLIMATMHTVFNKWRQLTASSWSNCR